jgi:glycosyltransferase involved in cell wall biosynthesis
VAGLRGAEPRTVLFLHPSAGGYGADRQLCLLATGLDRSRYRPLVVLPGPGDLTSRLDEAGVEVRFSELAVLQRSLLGGLGIATTLGLEARIARELGELARSRDTAIVHSNTTTVLGGQAVADRAGAAHVQHVREIYRGIGGPLGAVLWPILRRRLVRADALVCVSEAAAAQFDGAARPLVVYDAIPRDVTLPDREAARRAFGIRGDRFVVAVIARISDWKGQAVLLRALAEQALAEIGAVALVAGDARPGQLYFERELLELSRELGLDGRLRMLGFRDDVGPVLAAADALALPSRHPDALPNTALEAATAKVPVVATSTGGQTELVRDGVTGRLVPPGDAPALAQALRVLADDPAQGARFASAAAADARARFGRDRLLEEVQAHYDRLCEEPRRVA